MTTETVLFNEGMIAQNPNKITLMGKKQLEVECVGRTYWCRYSQPKLLVERAEIVDNGRYSIATAKRAKMDLWRVNPQAFIDKELK